MAVRGGRPSGSLRPVTRRPSEPALAVAILGALPCPTLVVDAEYRIVHANASARRAFRAGAGSKLGEVFACADVASGRCGEGSRCAGCAFRGAARRALAGEPARARGFLLRTGEGGEPADLHLLAFASPLEVDGARLAVLVLQDVDQLLADPGIVRVCTACGRVADEEGGWHPLHRYLEDRLGIAGDQLCGACAGGAERGGAR